MTAVLMTLALTSASARAACGFSGLGAGAGVKLPMLQTESALGAATTSAPSIVGLWGGVCSAGGKVFNETFDQWHSDGTEFESAFLPVLNGNLCVGVWKSTGANTVRLHHIGWTFDGAAGGTANGTFTLDENNTVSKDGLSYTGTFTFKAFNMTGGLLEQVSGTIVAERITVE